MSNPRNNDPSKSKSASDLTKANETTETVAEEVAVLPTPQEANTLQIVGRKTPSEVFDRLEQGNQMRENFNRFKEKLDVCEKFAGGYNNEALAMTIKNLGTGEEIQIQSIPLILEFVNDKVVTAGRSHLKRLEDEIVNFAI
jgi:hypothetical protein